MSKAGKREKVLINGEWYILCSTVPLITRKHTLKSDRAFVITDALGDIPVSFPTELGYYWRDTRFLSGFEMYVNDSRPVLLSSDIDSESRSILVEMTNTDFRIGDKVVQRTSLYIGKTITFDADDLLFKVVIRNLALFPVPVKVQFRFDADFRDIFEVRGTERKERGKRTVCVKESKVEFEYVGLDGLKRRCLLDFSPSNFLVSSEAATFEAVLEPKQKEELVVRIKAGIENRWSFSSDKVKKPLFESSLKIDSSSTLLNTVIKRSLRDLEMMLSDFDGCSVPMAGIPWYCALFGRDVLVTSLELLPWYPEIARDTLLVLSRYQAEEFDDFTDSEPGKILHELREGEMAKLREVPFVPYYGTADATCLFVILAAEYLKCSGDVQLVKSIWKSIVLAAEWMEHHGDINSDGFIEYVTRSSLGLRNQGWKDSHDAIHHSDGSLAEPPIAVVEVQGYKYRALKSLSFLCGCLGMAKDAERFDRRARELAGAIERVFWMEDRGFYALALDRNGAKCEVIASNAGHLLFAGAVSADRAVKVVDRLMSDEMFTGYGIRTLSRNEARYNPMSYHNGSVWPHDCAIICNGFVNYGFKREALRLFSAMLDAVAHFPDYRVPELFCGFPKDSFKPPVPYPVACSPQAWSSASVVFMLTSLLGMEVDALNKTLVFNNPVLPAFVKELRISGWKTPFFGPFSFRFVNVDGRVAVETLEKPAGWKVVVIVG